MSKPHSQFGEQMKRGMLYTLEAVIGAFLAFSTLLLVIFNPFSPPEFKFQTIRTKSYACLKALDKEAVLRDFVKQNETAKIENRLSDCMPSLTDYEVKICRRTCTAATLPENETRVGVEYFIAGSESKFDPVKVLLVVWGVF